MTDKKALHLKSLKTFTDVFGKKRFNGEEWHIKVSDCVTHIPDEVISLIDVITLNNR